MTAHVQVSVSGVAVAAERLAEVTQALLDCVCDALSAANRPVCSCYRALGTPVIIQCCECEEDEGSGELSVHLTRVFDADPESLNEIQRVRPCRGGGIAAQLRFVLARCRPVIDERGELPDHAVLDDVAVEQMRDVELLWRALTCCPDQRLRVDDVSVDLSEPGNCSVIYADVTVEMSIPAPPEV